MSRKKKKDPFDNQENFVGEPEPKAIVPDEVVMEDSQITVGEDGSLSGSGVTEDGDQVDWKLVPRPAMVNPNVPGERTVVLPSGCEFHRKENGEVWVSSWNETGDKVDTLIITPDEWACIISTMSWRDVESLEKAKAFHRGPNK